MIFVTRTAVVEIPEAGFAEIRRRPSDATTLEGLALADLLPTREDAHSVSRIDLEAHRANARECFDGMRAYHSSEISHTGHALALFAGILGSVIAAYGAMLSIATTDVREGVGLAILAFIFWVLLLLLLASTWRYTHQKIDSDHIRYEEFRSEWNKERAVLGILESWGRRHRQNKPGSGYNYTKRILSAVAFGIALLGLTGSLLVAYVSLVDNERAGEPPAVRVRY